MDSFSLTNVFNILSRIAFGSVIALPLSLSNYNLSHQEGLSLKYSKTAPPLAIFDDEKISFTGSEDTFPTTIKRAPLKTERLQIRKLALKISQKFAVLQKESLSTAPVKKQVRYLAGLSIQKSSPSVAVIKKTISAPTRELQVTTVKAQPPQPDSVSAAEKQQFLAQLPPNLRGRVEEIENFDEIMAEDYGTESFEQRANSVLAQAGVNQTAPTDREVANTYNTRTGSSRVTYTQRMQTAQDRATRMAGNFARNGLTKGTTRPTPKKDDPTDLIKDKSEEKGSAAVAAVGLPPQALIAGTLEMTKGLAYTGSQKIIVYRQIGGTRYEYGQVFIDQGRYEIFVDQPNTGVVVAELLENDIMVGRAEVLMPEIMFNAKSKDDYKNIPIKIEPILDQVVAENISAYSYYKKEKLKNSEIKIGESIDVSQKIFNSSIVMRASKENHWGNIILGSSKQLFTHILNPDATIKALQDILGIKTPKEQMGIIKGEVTIAGNRVAGAQIEVIGDSYHPTPVYFNSFIPDPSLTETTENGQYAFVDVPPGNYLVRAKYKGKYLSPQVAPVEAGYVTQVQFDVQKPSLAEAFVFDIQTSEMMNADISFLGSDNKVPVQARKLISFSGSQGIQFLEVLAQDQNYYATRMTVDKSDKEILIPMVSQNWMNDLLMRMRVNSIPDTGLIIGTALDLPYSVELDPNAYNEDTKIIYFDKQGKMVPGAMLTPAGGGFVAINVNQGIRSLFNKYHGTSSLKITTMAVDSKAVNIFTSKF